MQPLLHVYPFLLFISSSSTSFSPCAALSHVLVHSLTTSCLHPLFLGIPFLWLMFRLSISRSPQPHHVHPRLAFSLTLWVLCLCVLVHTSPLLFSLVFVVPSPWHNLTVFFSSSPEKYGQIDSCIFFKLIQEFDSHFRLWILFCVSLIIFVSWLV